LANTWGITSLTRQWFTGAGGDTDFYLLLKTPKWATVSSSLDDSNILHETREHPKTFGLSFLLDGLTEAYQNRAEEKNGRAAIKAFHFCIEK